MFQRALKSISRHPAFSIPAILMLAGGIAVSSVCYAVLGAAVLSAIPYEEATRLVQAMKSPKLASDSYWRLTRADFEILRHRARSFESLGYEVDVQGTIAGVPGGQTGVMIARVSPGLLTTLKMRPVLGRSFQPEDFQPGSPGVVLLSFGFWSGAFSANPGALGTQVMIDGRSYAVIGVAPRAVRRPVNVADIWIPDTSTETAPDAAALGDKLVVARLRQGVSLADAQRETEGLKPASIQGLPSTDTDRFSLFSFADQVVGAAGPILTLLLCACLSIQLLACLNVGHLLLARRMSKARDLGIQLALGCGKGRLCLNVLAEAAGVAVAAVLVAIPMVMILLPAAATVTSIAIRSETHANISLSVLAFSAGLGFLSSLICAVVPALLLLRLEVASLIHERWRMSELSLSASRVQDILIVVQMATAVLVMAGFGLLAKSVHQLSEVSLGFNSERLSYTTFDAGTVGFPASAHSLEAARESLARLPSVKSAAIGSTPLLTGAAMRLGVAALTDEGGWAALPPVLMQSVSGSYFNTMGVPLLAGRSFNLRDVRGAPCVAIVNRSFARLVWATPNATGRRIDISGTGSGRAPCEIVGVAGDTRDITIASPPEPAVFFSHLQRAGSGQSTILIRTSGGHAVPTESIRGIVAAVDPTRHWNFSTDVGSLVATAIKPASTRAYLLGGLAALALLLAAGGMYAAATFSLGQRAREFGIRMALGAGKRDLAALVYGHYARLAAAGALAGVAAGLSVGRFFGAGLSLFEVKSFDVAVFTIVPLAGIVAVLAAIAAPTRRAAAANPSRLLRSE